MKAVFLSTLLCISGCSSFPQPAGVISPEMSFELRREVYGVPVTTRVTVGRPIGKSTISVEP